MLRLACFHDLFHVLAARLAGLSARLGLAWPALFLGRFAGTWPKQPLLAEEDGEEAMPVARPRVEEPVAAPRCGLGLRDLSEEVHDAVLSCLRGVEAASVAASASFMARALADGQAWRLFLNQEFPDHDREAKALPASQYRELFKLQKCPSITWQKVPCRHRLGAREGSPGMFSRRGHVFVMGGWGRGPSTDVHAGRVDELPLSLSEIRVSGTAPHDAYESAITVLEEEEPWGDSRIGGEPFRVAFTGGYLYGGYQHESDRFGILEIRFPADGPPCGEWVATGEMAPRSNHSATYVPPRLAGAQFPEGYLAVVGGNKSGYLSHDVELLDLKTNTWITPYVEGEERGHARNTHSATLLGNRILVVSGGTGDDTNSGPPRGGQDVSDAWWLESLHGGRLRWAPASDWERDPQISRSVGRGHKAFRIGRTGTVVTFSGGLRPDRSAVAFVDGKPRLVDMRGPPPGRALGGGCTLADGTLIIYGGWLPRGPTFNDVWAGHIGDQETEFTARLSAARAQNPPDDEGDEDDMLMGLDRRLLLQLRGEPAHLQQLMSLVQGAFGREIRGGHDEEDDDEEEEAEASDDSSEAEDEVSEGGAVSGGEEPLLASEPQAPEEDEEDMDPST
mmetsp:Transcript_38576/g.110821  ORF Transcript_38576/g.110821 Transcript_38576/m.110821 type:complete len:620 (-) Transcript_38576:197-2056(-)